MKFWCVVSLGLALLASPIVGRAEQDTSTVAKSPEGATAEDLDTAIEGEVKKESVSDLLQALHMKEVELSAARQELQRLKKDDVELVSARQEIERLKKLVIMIRDASRRERASMHYNMACVYRESGMLRQAETEFLKAAEINPSDADVHYNLGILYEEDLKDKVRARTHYKQFLELRPTGPDAAKVTEWLTSLQ